MLSRTLGKQRHKQRVTRGRWRSSPNNGRVHWDSCTRAPFQYPIRRLIVRSRKVSKRDLYLELSKCSDIWQAHRRHCWLPMCLSNFKAIRWLKLLISWFRDFMRSYDKTVYRILKLGPGLAPNNIYMSHYITTTFEQWITKGVKGGEKVVGGFLVSVLALA